MQRDFNVLQHFAILSLDIHYHTHVYFRQHKIHSEDTARQVQRTFN